MSFDLLSNFHTASFWMQKALAKILFKSSRRSKLCLHHPLLGLLTNLASRNPKLSKISLSPRSPFFDVKRDQAQLRFRTRGEFKFFEF